MKLYLHPGFPKCGSSSIQTVLYRNWETLLAEGLALPDQSFSNPFDEDYNREKPGPANSVFHELANGGDRVAFIRKLDRWVELGAEEGLCGLVISAENLANYGEGYFFVLEAFRERFENVEVLAYLRKQDDFFLASWQQWIYHQGIPFEEFAAARLKSLYPNFYSVAQRLESVLGAGRVMMRPLVKEGLKDGDLVRDFLDWIGASRSIDTAKGGGVNRSLNPYLCEVLSKFGKVEGRAFSNQLKLLLAKNCSDHEVLLEKCPEFLDFETRRRILDAFEESNRKLHEAYFPELDFDSVFGLAENAFSDSARAELRLKRMEDVATLLAEVVVLCYRDEIKR